MSTLEMVVRVTGEVDLLNVDSGETLWTSDGDNDFWEFIETDFVEESDLDEVLGYLADAEVLSQADLDEFENGGYDIIIEEAADDSDGNVIDGEIAEDED